MTIQLRLILTVMLCVAANLVALAQSTNYGLTDAQMLEMGREGFRKYHSTKAGESTADMVECEVIFGQALYRRNAKLEKRVSVNKQSIVAELRRDLGAYSLSVIEIMASFSGGGTIWSPIRAAVMADVEEVLYTLVGGKAAKPAPKRVTSDVSKILTTIRSKIEKNKKELDTYRGSGFGYGSAVDAHKGASNAYVSIVAQAKRLSRSESDRVLEYCRKEAALVLEEGG